MNDDDTPFATDSGRNLPARGQILDRITADDLIALDIEQHLKKVITKGKNLADVDCRQLASLNALTQVRRFIVRRHQSPVPGRHLLERSWLAPADVGQVIEAALDRMDPTHGRAKRLEELSDAADVLLFHQTEVLRRMFGLTRDTKGRESTQRRRIAHQYYAEHANFRHRTINTHKFDNFMKRICPDELFPPLIEALSDWESELRALTVSDDRGLAWSQAMLTESWRAQFWQPFRVFQVLSDACVFVRLYFVSKRHNDNDAARNEAHASLGYIGDLWRFSRPEKSDDQGSQDDLDAVHKLISLFFSDFRSAFSFNTRDEGWINDVLDGKISFWSPSEDPEGRGALALARYLALFEPCDCPKTLYGLYEVMHAQEYTPSYEIPVTRMPIHAETQEFNQIYIDDVGIVQEFRDLLSDLEASEASPLSLLCPIHILLCWQQILRSALRDAWWNEARALVQMTMDQAYITPTD